MCDIGRFDYHWIESDDRLRRPLVRDERGLQQTVSWAALTSALRDRLSAAGTGDPDGREISALGPRLERGAVPVRPARRRMARPGRRRKRSRCRWRAHAKMQPPQTTFMVPAVDAPNVNGARLLGLTPGACGDAQGAGRPERASGGGRGRHGHRALRLSIRDPQDSIGDTGAGSLTRAPTGRLPLLIVQGVLLTDLARAADFVIPGASFVEKEASYVNDKGRLQGTVAGDSSPRARRWKTGRFW